MRGKSVQIVKNSTKDKENTMTFETGNMSHFKTVHKKMSQIKAIQKKGMHKGFIKMTQTYIDF